MSAFVGDGGGQAVECIPGLHADYADAVADGVRKDIAGGPRRTAEEGSRRTSAEAE